MVRPTAAPAQSDFLQEECGRHALQLAARGSTIIAELLGLSEHIPTPFVAPEKTAQAALISDYTYFPHQEVFDQRIRSSETLRQEDEDFAQTHMELLERFFHLFRSVYLYAVEVNRFVRDIQSGAFVSHTLDTVLANTDGKQLLCEVIHLCGVMLLLLDYKIGGRTREHLIVSYIRYRGAGEPHTVEVVDLCRSTGYLPDHPLPVSYPVPLFRRVAVDPSVVLQLVSRLRGEDIYQMAVHYPAPEHRCVAMALQGALLYILLFFTPEVLAKDAPVMREIVDKHFADNWVVNYYLGFTTDLTVAWAGFPAASAAIAHTVALDHVQYHQRRLRAALGESNAFIASLLREGVLTEDYVLDHIYASILPTVREANVVLRWIILHGTRGERSSGHLPQYAASYTAVRDGVVEDDIITLLLRTAQLEYQLRVMFTDFLKDKRHKWSEARRTAVDRTTKLALFYGSDNVLGTDTRDEALQEWFETIAGRIDGLQYKNAQVARRKLQKLIKALDSVLEFHQVAAHLQVVQYVKEARQQLEQMLRCINIESRVLVTITTVADFSYAWERMATCGFLVKEIQSIIKRHPALAVQMRAVFVKLSSVLELPCSRIDQAASYDRRLVVALESTSEYYSAELVAFVRRVLHVIPLSIFEELRKVMTLVTSDLRECPSKLTRQELNEYSQLRTRRHFSLLTATIAKYAKGILAMESTVVGVVNVDSHQLLEDGIRKELVALVTKELHDGIHFTHAHPLTAPQLVGTLEALGKRLNGIRDAFECVQDYLNVEGLRLWNEEFARIAQFNVEMECNSFLQKQIYPWNSASQSVSIPIPYYERQNERSAYSFLGHLVQHLFYLTDPAHATFLPVYQAWFTRGAVMEESVGLRLFAAVSEALGPIGLASLDRLLCFITAKDVQVVVRAIRTAIDSAQEPLNAASRQLCPVSQTPANAAETYQALVKAVGASFPDVTERLHRIGRMQLMREMLTHQLRFVCRIRSGTLHGTLSTANEALRFSLYQNYHDPDSCPPCDDEVERVRPLLNAAGLADPATAVYIATEPIPELVFYLLPLTLRLLPRVTYDGRLACCAPVKPQDPVDPTAFLSGVTLLLKQFHEDQTELYLAHLSQAIRAQVVAYPGSCPAQQQLLEVLPSSAETLSVFITTTAQFTRRPLSTVQRLLPPTLLGRFRHLAPATAVSKKQ